MNLRPCIQLLAIACAALAAFAGAAAQASTQHRLNVTTADGRRDYILSSPDGASGPLPLVLVLHGHLGTAANAFGAGAAPSPLSAWLAIAQRERVLVAALQGLKGTDNHTGWHDCRLDAIEDPVTDDVSFAQGVVQSLVQSGRADPHRIYVMGMSNGGMMAYRLALEMHPTPAAIAAVSSTMASKNACGETPPRVSVLLINGTADAIVPYGGGKVGFRGHKTGTVIGADATRDFWLRADHLPAAPTSSYTFPHRSADDPTTAVRQVYGQPGGLQVETITIQDGGHVEPSLLYHYGWFYSRLVGTQNQDLESAEEAWTFFKDKVAR
ncbi:MAG: PHB depolymerase family esterase [Nevskia sp.]|nr:PHB depolymerase family esterase [Nevskia sp.]